METLAADGCYRLDRLAVNGGDVLAAGLRPGPAVGQALDILLNAVMGRHAAQRAHGAAGCAAARVLITGAMSYGKAAPAGGGGCLYTCLDQLNLKIFCATR